MIFNLLSNNLDYLYTFFFKLKTKYFYAKIHIHLVKFTLQGSFQWRRFWA